MRINEIYLNLSKGSIATLNSRKIANIDITWISIYKVESYKAFEEEE